MIIEKANRLTMHEARRNSGYFPHKVPFGWNAVGVRSGTLTYVGYAPPVTAPRLRTCSGGFLYS